MLVMGSVVQVRLPRAIKVKLSILKEIIQLYAVEFRVFRPFSPHPFAFTRNCSNALHYACDGVCDSKEARKCNKGLIEAF